MELKDRVFVVTGAGNGIGREVAVQLLDAGARVAGVDLSERGLGETASRAEAGERFSIHALDITNRDAVFGLPEAVTAAHGQVDGLVNVAGIIQRFVPVMELTFEDMEKVMNVNFWGVMNMCKAFLPLLVERPGASLVNVASMGAYAPVPGQSVYGASKAAVALLTQALYAELMKTGVAVTVIYPGAIATDIAANSGAMPANTAAKDPDAEPSTYKTTPAPDAGRVIVTAIRKGSYRATIGSDAAAMDKLTRLNPKMATEIIAKKMGDLLG